MSYRLFVPLMNEEQEGAVDEEQDVDDSKKVVWIPECIEAGYSVEGGW